jgi:hypothetical protein
MSKFEEDLMNSIKCTMTKQVTKQDFIKIEYDDRVKLPSDFIEKAWGLIDQEDLIKSLSKRLESELIDKLVNHLAAEIATDIKQVLSVKERREAVRSVVRDNIDKLTKSL